VLVLVCGVSDRWGRAGVVWTHPDFCMLHVCRRALADGLSGTANTPPGHECVCV
jgi:hypothetical protein